MDYPHLFSLKYAIIYEVIDMDYIQGVVKIVMFHSEENLYTVCKIDVLDSSEPLNIFQMDDDYLTVTGYMVKPVRGEEIRFFGTFKEHPRYGRQYVVKSYEKMESISIAGLVEYLASDLFNGVGIKTATNIVAKLGKDAINKIMNDKEVLRTVPKLSDKLIDILYDGIVENKSAEHTLIKLYGYDISPKMAMKIFHQYGQETMAIIEQNPYQLMMDIDGIGFERADIIAKKLDFDDHHPLRIKAMIVYLYQYMGTNYGHTYLTRNQLLEYLENALSKSQVVIPLEEIETYLNELLKENVFHEEDSLISLKQVHYARSNIAKKIVELLDVKQEQINNEDVDNYIEFFEKRCDIEYTKTQKKAIKDVIGHQLFVLTGGPGTGKTTVIKGIIDVFTQYYDIPIIPSSLQSDIRLVAPTGRAAKRMSEVTGLYAETIHRFLGYGFDGKFMHDKENLVSAKLIIIDEASMVDVYLASQLFQSIPNDTKVVVVGDKDQLPSVGPGQVLFDLLSVERIPKVMLNQIFRQAKNSHIVDLAYHINESIIPEDLMSVYDDRLYVAEEVHSFHNRLIKSLDYLISEGYNLYDDIQVLIPMYRGSTGIDQVNALIQKTYNTENGLTIEHNGRIFKTGDKVIQLTNQAEDQIMNGDQGIIVGVTNEKKVIVEFDGREITYNIGDLINLKHAYAISIHKSQGSEYKVVVLPVFRNYKIMLNKKLLYTAVTRAKEKLIVMGDTEAFRFGVKQHGQERQSLLKDVIEGSFELETPILNEIYINDPAIPFDTLGEEFGEELSPYDFLKD